MTRAIAPETAYTRERLTELAEIEPRLDGVLTALSELAARCGSVEQIAAVERLSELGIHAAHLVEEFILNAGVVGKALDRRHQAADGAEPAQGQHVRAPGIGGARALTAYTGRLCGTVHDLAPTDADPPTSLTVSGAPADPHARQPPHLPEGQGQGGI